MARTYQQAEAGLLPDEPILVVGQPAAFDPPRAPEGRRLRVQVRMAPGSIAGDAKGEIAAIDWDRRRRTLRGVGAVHSKPTPPAPVPRYPARRIVTPVELEADNPNLVGGRRNVCGSHHLSQHFLSLTRARLF